MEINISEINSQDIKCIIFDLGGVIIDIDIDKTIAAFENLNIKGLKAEDVLANNQLLFYKLEIGTITPSQFISCFRQTYPAAEKVSEDKIWEAWNALLLPFKHERIELLQKLKSHYNIYLLSNTNLPHRIRFKQLYHEQFGYNFEDLFIECFYSDEMHLHKPDPMIYEQVTEAIKTEGSKILFIDDLQANIDAAIACGWNAHRLNNDECITNLFRE